MASAWIVRSPGAEHYPPRWGTWSDLAAKGYVPTDIGCKCRVADLNRFAARYRIANAFAGVTLEGYGDTTVRGYTGLFKLFLAWTAFEQYLTALPQSQEDCITWLHAHVTSDIITTIRASDDGYRFFRMIAARTNAKNRTALDRFIAGDPFNFSYLASSVRHVFAHGFLTPHANRADPSGVRRLCDEIAAVHLAAAGHDFERRVSALLSKTQGAGDS